MAEVRCLSIYKFQAVGQHLPQMPIFAQNVPMFLKDDFNISILVMEIQNKPQLMLTRWWSSVPPLQTLFSRSICNFLDDAINRVIIITFLVKSLFEYVGLRNICAQIRTIPSDSKHLSFQYVFYPGGMVPTPDREITITVCDLEKTFVLMILLVLSMVTSKKLTIVSLMT